MPSNGPPMTIDKGESYRSKDGSTRAVVGFEKSAIGLRVRYTEPGNGEETCSVAEFRTWRGADSSNRWTAEVSP